MPHLLGCGLFASIGHLRPFEKPLPTGKPARHPLRHRGCKNSAPLLSHLRYFEVQILPEGLLALQSIFICARKNRIERMRFHHEIDDA
jgi:hypothetical protein